jgi:hypothetical protein
MQHRIPELPIFYIAAPSTFVVTQPFRVPRRQRWLTAGCLMTLAHSRESGRGARANEALARDDRGAYTPMLGSLPNAETQ